MLRGMKFVPVEEMRSPVCQALWRWYTAQEVESGWPPKDAFRPEDLPARALPHIGVVDVEREPFRVFYRLVGSAIAESLGRQNIQGYLDTLGVPQEAELTELYRHTVTVNRPVFLAGMQQIDGETFHYEGGAVPLGAPDDAVRRFIIFEDYLNTDTWRGALRRRSYKRDPDAGV